MDGAIITTKYLKMRGLRNELKENSKCCDTECGNEPAMYEVAGTLPVIPLLFFVCEKCGKELQDDPDSYLRKFHRYYKSTEDREVLSEEALEEFYAQD